MASNQKGKATMTPKKAHDKAKTPSRLSLASRLLGGALPAPLPVPSPQEPWRNKKGKGKRGAQRHQ
jgi:hypothetical protein